MRFDPEIDDFKPEAVQRAVAKLDWLARYHRHETRQLQLIPEGPAVLVGNHSGGLSLGDGLFLLEYYRQTNFRERVYVLAHDLLFRTRWLSELMASLGILRASRGRARHVLEAGHKLLVFPGGDVEAMRPFSQRARVNLAGRTGWLQLSAQTGAPIVPVVGAGGHETMMIIRQGRRFARALGVHRWARIDSFPLMFCLPWGLLMGPTAGLPYLPLPAKITVSIAPPMPPPQPTDIAIWAAYQRIEELMQNMLADLYRERRLPILG